MNRSVSPRIHYGIQAALLFGLALFTGALVKTNSLHDYLAPRTEKWMFWCPVLLGLMAVFTAYRTIAPDDDPVCGCSHEAPKSLLSKMFVYGLFILPLGLGILLPDRALGSSAAAAKGFSYTVPLLDEHVSKDLASSAFQSGLLRQESGPGKAFLAPGNKNTELAQLAELLYAEPVIEVNPDIYAETLAAIELFKQEFAGRTIALTGFVYKDKSIGQNGQEFAVGRFLVLCCTADALPFGVSIQLPAGMASPEQDAWVRVTGTLKADTGGQEGLIIDAARVVQVNQPAVPYVYSDENSHADAVSALIQKENAQ
ncbi:TIGR03943 family putative permease subunit [Paenibacillus pinistramenti]|uniref:TIGR03943 family putative permease subunit n=1 Tax=Paenibacillus pinistramenti TaxID=1768003 RepID=UPI001396BA0D|nr:TIGR03943 family protein [Paenibacillus pinistramenti]